MTLFEDDSWRKLPPREKEHLRDRLAEAIACTGRPVHQVPSPGVLAVQHEPSIQVQRPHLEKIDAALRWALETPSAKVMIWTPPQVGKSHRVSRWLPFWWLTHNPRDRILMASYAASLAETHGAACRDLVVGYGARYGLRMKDDENTRSDWTVTAGGGLRSRGVKGGITGQAMNLGIIDDPYADRAAAESSTIRRAVWEWYSSAFVTRRAPAPGRSSSTPAGTNRTSPAFSSSAKAGSRRAANGWSSTSRRSLSPRTATAASGQTPSTVNPGSRSRTR
ncbi:hypothetical protein GS461_09815 [Rhodococcus hoagii]|nr:hypothetical protein [Prescottella equi]